MKRVAVLRDPANPAGSGQWGAILSVAPSFGVELSPINTRADAGEMERALVTFARRPNGGLILTASTSVGARRDAVMALVARQRLPAVYHNRYYVTGGGLMSYGPDTMDQHRRAAGYIDRVLKGENLLTCRCKRDQVRIGNQLKTAKRLNLAIPAALLALADEVIE